MCADLDIVRRDLVLISLPESAIKKTKHLRHVRRFRYCALWLAFKLPLGVRCELGKKTFGRRQISILFAVAWVYFPSQGPLLKEKETFGRFAYFIIVRCGLLLISLSVSAIKKTKHLRYVRRFRYCPP